MATDLGEDLNIAQAAGHHRVLLADDNQDMRDYIARLLQSKGYVVETVADGEAALAAARARPPDLILSDVMMPRLDGLGLLNALRQDPQLRDLPMILLSARAGEEARVGGLSAGADDYLSKPFSARELLARVASNLQLARIRGEAEAGLRQAQEDLSAALAASNTATYRWDAGTGEFISYDDNLKRLFGFGADEPVEQFDDFIRRIHPDDMPEIEVALAATRQGADFESEYRVVLPDGNMRWIYSRGKTIRDAGGAAVLVGACTDITDRKREEEHRERLLDELNHRVKNMLAIVQSLAMQTLRRAGGMEEARDALDARLLSLSRAHDVLTAEHWEGGDFETAVKNALEAWADAGPSGRFRMQGEPLRLRPKALLALSMALHELATNAVKYGALSNDTGYIDIHWEIMREEPRRFRLRWVERGGPAVVPPRRRGFGSRLIQQGLAIDVAGEVRLDFPHEGVVFALDAPLKEIQGRAAPR